MAKRTDRAVATTEVYRDDCPYCVKNAATLSTEGARRRYLHYIALAEHDGIDALEKHLTLYLHRWFPGDVAQAREVIRSTLRWMYDLITTYTGMADSSTGEKLPWGEARRQIFQGKGSHATRGTTYAF